MRIAGAIEARKLVQAGGPGSGRKPGSGSGYTAVLAKHGYKADSANYFRHKDNPEHSIRVHPLGTSGSPNGFTHMVHGTPIASGRLSNLDNHLSDHARFM